LHNRTILWLYEFWVARGLAPHEKGQGAWGCTLQDVRLSDKRGLSPFAPESRGVLIGRMCRHFFKIASRDRQLRIAYFIPGKPLNDIKFLTEKLIL